MTYYYAGLEYDPNYFTHHGIKGQKWGIRRFQNEDGSLTKAGEERYYGQGSARRFERDLNKADSDYAQAVGRYRKAEAEDNRLTNKAMKYVNKHGDANALSEKQKKKIGKMIEAHKTLKKAKKAAMKDMKDIEAHQYKLMGAAASQGHSVIANDTYRDVRSVGKNIADIYVFGPIGATLLASYEYGGANNIYVQGKRFKVKKDGQGTVQI